MFSPRRFTLKMTSIPVETCCREHCEWTTLSILMCILLAMQSPHIIYSSCMGLCKVHPIIHSDGLYKFTVVIYGCAALYSAVPYFVQCCTLLCTLLYLTLYSAVPYFVQCCTFLCTVLYLTLYSAVPYFVQCCTLLCTVLYLSLYSAVPFFVQCCTILWNSCFNARDEHRLRLISIHCSTGRIWLSV
jgi:hypothetical protein